MKIGLSISVLLFIIIIPSASALTFDSPRILLDGNSVQQIDINTQVQFQAHLTSDSEVVQPFVFVTTVNDSKGDFISEAWISTAIKPGKTLYPELSWIPEQPETYTIILGIYDNLESGNQLASPLFLILEVTGEPVIDPILALQEENQLLKERITELEKQIDNLNQIIMEQLNVIYTWILGQ